MAILVTGGAGYIGSHMVLHLADAGERNDAETIRTPQRASLIFPLSQSGRWSSRISGTVSCPPAHGEPSNPSAVGSGLLLDRGFEMAKSITRARRFIPGILVDHDNELTPLARGAIVELYDLFSDLNRRVTSFDHKFDRAFHENETCQRITRIKGVVNRAGFAGGSSS